MREKLKQIVKRAAHSCLPSNTQELHINLLVTELLSSGVVVREKGEWERYADDKFNGYDAHGRIKYRKVYIYECSRCGENTAAKRNFCPNCGADMRGAVNDG